LCRCFHAADPNSTCARPVVAVVACQSPDGYAVCDGTSLAAAHVTALAALVLAHHGDFRSGFASRDLQRIERLFQILKGTAQPIGAPWQTGAGLPNAAQALGVTLRASAARGAARCRTARDAPRRPAAGPDSLRRERR